MNIKDELLAKEVEVNKLKKKLSQENWKQWSDKVRSYLNNAIGKAFISQSTNDSFGLYRVNGYDKRQYFNFPDYKCWFEIKTDGLFIINNYSYDKSIKLRNESNFLGNIDAIKYNKKKNGLKILMPEYSNRSLGEQVMVSTSNMALIGNKYIDGVQDSQCKDEPPIDSTLGLFTYEVPMEFYNEIAEIYRLHIQSIINFYSKWEEKMKTFPRYNG